MLATSEVIPSRGVRALEGEGGGSSHLEVAARGRLWRQLASRGIDRGAQRVNAYLLALILSLCSSCDYRPRCRQLWTQVGKASAFPTLYRYALDTWSCLAMSTECERIFSSAKKLITPERNALSEDIIEACECLKSWWKKDLIQQQE